MRVAETLRFLIGPFALLHEQAGPRLRRLTRLGLCALWMVKLLLDPVWRLHQLPPELWQPIGLLGLVPHDSLVQLFHTSNLILLWLAIVGTLAGCLFARREETFALTCTLAAFLLTIYSCVIRSFGPAVHTDIVELIAMYILAGFAWADIITPASVKKKGVPDHRASYPLVLIIATLCLTYCFVGLNRALVGGTGVFTGNTMEVWAVDASLRGYYFNTNIGWHVPQWPFVLVMLRLGLPFITLCEICAPLCLVSSHFRWIFIPIMLSFHLMSLFLMNIFFFDDMLLYLLMVDWSRRFPSLAVARSRAVG